MDDAIHTCQAIQLAAMDVLDNLTSNPNALSIPAYRELTERMYMAARQAAVLARVMGDDQTATFTDSICDKIAKRADL